MVIFTFYCILLGVNNMVFKTCWFVRSLKDHFCKTPIISSLNKLDFVRELSLTCFDIF